MTKPAFSESDLEAFLDEALPAEEMARIEKALRAEPALVRRHGGDQRLAGTRGSTAWARSGAATG